MLKQYHFVTKFSSAIMLYTTLSNLLPFKSPGPDNLHPFILKSLCDIVCEPLVIVFKTSLDALSLPNIWKTANVSSIFTKKDRSDPSNYCHISLTCVACNIMTSIIKGVVITYLLENNLLSNCLFAFVSGRSVQLQLLSLLSHWTDILDSGHTIDVIYLDFKKVFDSVPHIHLLSKLHSYGFCDPLLSWLKSFLIGRSQSECVHDTVSLWHASRMCSRTCPLSIVCQ